MQLLLVYVVIIGAVMIFMTSRGRKKQQAQQLMMREALRPGVEARTIGGLVGEVVDLTDEHVILETTPGVRLKFVKTAIAGVVQPATDEAEIGETAAELGPDEEPEPSAEDEETDAVAPRDTVVAEAEKALKDAAAESSESTNK